MHKWLKIITAGTLATAGMGSLFGLALATSASAVTGPTCATATSALLIATLGGKSTSAGVGSTSTASFYGYKETALSCSYTTVIISFSTPATTADYKLALKTLTTAAGAKSVSGIGDGAFTGTGSSSVCTAGGTCTNSTVDNLWVLAAGKSFFELSVSTKVGYVKEEALAKKLIALL